MANPTANDILELKRIVKDFLVGKSIKVTRDRLAELADNLDCRCEMLYEAIPIDPKASDPLVDAILGHLNIQKIIDPQNNPGRYEKLLAKSRTLHELLRHISHDGELQVAYLLRLIDRTTPKYNWPLIFGISALISAILGAFAYFEKAAMQALGQWLTKTFPVVVDWLAKTFSILHNISLLGLLYNGLVLIKYWHSAITKGSITSDEKLNTLLFKSLSSSLTMLAYSLSYFAAGIMTGLPATLFVLSASVGVFRSIFIWYKSSETLAKLEKPPFSVAWQTQAEYIRALNYNQRHQHSFWIELSAAILTTAAVAIWDFFPPNLAVSAFCVIFITLTGLAEKSMLSHIEELNAKSLQRELDHLPNIQEPLLSLEGTDNYAKIQQMREDLLNEQKHFADKVTRSEIQLAERESEIARREALIAKKERELDQLIQDLSKKLEQSAESIRNIRKETLHMPTASTATQEEPQRPASNSTFTTIHSLFGRRSTLVSTPVSFSGSPYREPNEIDSDDAAAPSELAQTI
jgi:hypothetical protein